MVGTGPACSATDTPLQVHLLSCAAYARKVAHAHTLPVSLCGARCQCSQRVHCDPRNVRCMQPHALATIMPTYKHARIAQRRDLLRIAHSHNSFPAPAPPRAPSPPASPAALLHPHCGQPTAHAPAKTTRPSPCPARRLLRPQLLPGHPAAHRQRAAATDPFTHR